MTHSQIIVHSTVQVEAINPGESIASFGTGFILGMNYDLKNSSYVPLLITNKHVVNGKSTIQFVLSLASPDGSLLPGKTCKIVLSPATIILHPDKDVDLVAISLVDALNEMAKNGIHPFYTAIPEYWIPDDSKWASFDAIETILTTGYPLILRDTVNNLPISRRGITATPPSVDFMGKHEFLVDYQCFEGCSGSPIFIRQELTYEQDGILTLNEEQIWLTGILYSGRSATKHTTDSSGEDIEYSVEMGLGHAIKSSELLMFKKLFGVTG